MESKVIRKKQITFPKPMECTHVYPDGSEERVRYGQYEGLQIVKENGWEACRTKILIVPTYLVTEVTKEDGTVVIFDKPFYCIEKRNYNDDSGRSAPNLWE